MFDKERYSRHLMLPAIGEEGQQRLTQARVLLVGVGGLGSPIALYLAAAGVGHLGIVDDDRVARSNLQRQVLYTEEDIEKPKVECAARRLQAHNSALTVTPYCTRLSADNAEEIIHTYDLVIDGCDNFATRLLMDQVCQMLGIPYLYGSIGEFTGQVGLFSYRGNITYRTLYPESMLETVDSTHLPKGVMGVVPGVVGTLQATEAIKWIVRCGETLEDQLLIIDLLNLNFQRIAL